MYWRYFLWNFVGRQSDIQPTRTTITDGNWLSGIKWIDELYLGPQDSAWLPKNCKCENFRKGRRSARAMVSKSIIKIRKILLVFNFLTSRLFFPGRAALL